jgi:hypothetical protein
MDDALDLGGGGGEPVGGLRDLQLSDQGAVVLPLSEALSARIC